MVVVGFSAGGLDTGTALLVDDDTEVDTVTAVLSTSTPPNTAGTVHVNGAPAELGVWLEPGVEMAPLGGGYWAVMVELPRDLLVEYKYTQGTWITVEKNPDGTDVLNRSFVNDTPQVVRDAVARWAQ